jgi:hypothetical protein
MRPIKTKTRVKTASKKAVFKVLDIMTLMPPVYQRVSTRNVTTVSLVSTLKAFIPPVSPYPFTKPMLSKSKELGWGK